MPKKNYNLLFYTFLFILAGISIYIRSHDASAGTDISWLLVVAKKWLAGGQYFKDFYETNPPASFLIYLPAYWLSGIIGFDSLVCVNILYSLLVVICLSQAVKISGRYGFFQNELEEKSMFFILFLGFAILPDGQTVAQRDVILTLVSLPYLLKILCCNHAEKRIDGYFYMAMLALWIKPQYAIVHIILWLFSYCMYGIKIKWYEPFFMVFSLLIYALVINAFFYEWWYIIWVTIKTYDAYSVTLYLLIPKILMIIVLSSFFYVLGGNKNTSHYMIIGISCSLLALAQKKYFPYYYFSGEILALSNAIFLLKNKISNNFNYAKLAKINMFFGGAISLLFLAYSCYQENANYTLKISGLKTVVEANIDKAVNNNKIFIFSLYIDASYPFLRNYSGSNYPAMFPVKKFLDDNYFEYQEILQAFRANLAEDFLKNKPRLVVIPYAYINKDYALSMFIDKNNNQCKPDSEINQENKDHCQSFKRLEKVLDIIDINSLLKKNYHLIKFIRLDESNKKVAVYLLNG